MSDWSLKKSEIINFRTANYNDGNIQVTYLSSGMKWQLKFLRKGIYNASIKDANFSTSWSYQTSMSHLYQFYESSSGEMMN